MISLHLCYASGALRMNFDEKLVEFVCGDQKSKLLYFLRYYFSDIILKYVIN